MCAESSVQILEGFPVQLRTPHGRQFGPATSRMTQASSIPDTGSGTLASAEIQEPPTQDE